MDIVVSEEFCEVDSEVVISVWLVDDGDLVEAGMPICEIMAEKAQMEFTSPATGTIKTLVKIEQALRTGDVIATID